MEASEVKELNAASQCSGRSCGHSEMEIDADDFCSVHLLMLGEKETRKRRVSLRRPGGIAAARP